MFDNCSDTTLISEETVKRSNILGSPVRYTLIFTDRREEAKFGSLYKLVLIAKNGKMIHIQAFGIPKLLGSFSSVQVCGIKNVFDRNHGVTDRDLERDGGDLDLLIGTDLAELDLRQVNKKRKLVLLESIFGSGWTLFGQYKKIIDSEGDNYDMKVYFANNKDMHFIKFFSIESVGINVSRKCNSCNK